MKIYAVKISDISDKMLGKISLLINSEKLCRVEKFINKEDKIRTLVGELLIRSLIFQKLGIRNKNISFEKNQYGKPYLKGYPEFHFNISHSGEYVVCAIDDKSIGIDIEKVRHTEYKDIVKSFFTLSEFDYIMKEDFKIELNKFYEIWTLKESYIKCCGQGLSIPLKSFSVNIDKCENIKVIVDNEYKEHVFKKMEIGDGYKIAICSINMDIPNHIIEIDQFVLLNECCNLD